MQAKLVSPTTGVPKWMEQGNGRVSGSYGKPSHSAHLFRQENGEHILFCKDKWLGLNPLKDTYQRLFSLATNPDPIIAENREGNSWNLILRRNLNDWENEDFLALLNCLQNSPVNSLRRDRIKWGSSRNGSYTVKEGYLRSEIQEEFD